MESDNSDRPRSCILCNKPLQQHWPKASCQKCISSIINEDNTASCKDFMFTMRQEMVETFKAFRESLPTTSAQDQQSVRPVKPKKATSKSPRIIYSSEEEQDSHHDTGEPESKSSEELSDYEDPEDAFKSSRFKFASEETEELLKAIYSTLDIPQKKISEKSLHDKLYMGMEPSEQLCFPVHNSMKNLITLQWKEPDKKLFISKGFKRRFPFSEEDAKLWESCPKLDAAFSQVEKDNELAFEDLGRLKDPGDKRIEFSLKKAWSACATNFKPAAATTCVSRTMSVWLERIKKLVEQDAPKKDILEAIEVVEGGNDYVIDAASESLRVTAKSTALINNARRNLWLKTWEGSQASKARACSLPFQGKLLFGPQLQEVLERTASKKTTFPKKRKFEPKKRPFFRRNQTQGRDQQRRKPWMGNKAFTKKNPLFRAAENKDKP
ncbi:lamina-associated polypeptide 2-like [Hyperolius riggenbachi]|uniref:lamina-associated polypeptide 2-like n=1 Tax=Hyperolius riggenbachi TaxID=752182 RepID=UPI0035A338E1